MKVATPPEDVTGFVPPVTLPQLDERRMLSVTVPPDSVTVKFPNATPAVPLVGALVNPRVAAEAAPTPISVTPARTIIDAAPTPTIERIFENPNLLLINFS
jgi:hypothetical protein